MRAHHAIAVVAVVFVGVGVKLTQLSSVQAQFGGGEAVRLSSWNSGENRDVTDLPVEKVHDMSFIFSGGDLTSGGIAPATSDEPRQGWFTPRCAERDLRAFSVIEEFGQIDQMPSAWLADAGLSYLQARSYCLSGAETEGVIAYDRIIAGDARMTNARTLSERVTR